MPHLGFRSMSAKLGMGFGISPRPVLTLTYQLITYSAPHKFVTKILSFNFYNLITIGLASIFAAYLL